jgi:hypothetical protein
MSHTFLTAVAIDVVTSEENIRLVTVDDLGEPPKRLTRRRVAKVLLEDLGRVTPTENVIACLTADSECLVETLLDVRVLGSIARCVNGVLTHRASVPGCRGSGRCGSSYSDSHRVLTRSKRRGKDCRSSKEHERGDTSNHCDLAVPRIEI